MASLPFVTVDDAPHVEEHSLEVQLPLLQKLIGDFVLAPFAVGTATNEQVAAVLDALWGRSGNTHRHQLGFIALFDTGSGRAA